MSALRSDGRRVIRDAGGGLQVANEREQVLFAQLSGEGRHDRRETRDQALFRQQNRIADVAIVSDDCTAVRQVHPTSVQAVQIRRVHRSIWAMTAAASMAAKQCRTAGCQTLRSTMAFQPARVV